MGMMSLETLAWWLPVIGVVALALSGQFLRGATRRMTLAILPFLLGCVMWWLSPLMATDSSNWLVGLAKLFWYGLTYLGICIYYVVFLVSATGLWLRHNAKQRAIESKSLVAPSNEPVEPVEPAEPASISKQMAAAWKG